MPSRRPYDEGMALFFGMPTSEMCGTTLPSNFTKLSSTFLHCTIAMVALELNYRASLNYKCTYFLS